MMHQDMHLHTDFSDGENTPEEMLVTAIRCGLKEICFTDHVRRDTLWWDSYQKECKRLQLKYPQIHILCGVEAKICNFCGDIDVPDNLKGDIFRVAAIHRLPLGDGNYLKRDELFQFGTHALECWLQAIDGLKNNSEISRLAHPFSLLPFMNVFLDMGFWNEVSQIFRKTTYRLEYNLKYDNSFVPLSFWEEFSHRIDVGSDSHSVSALSQIWTSVEQNKKTDRALSLILSETRSI